MEGEDGSKLALDSQSSVFGRGGSGGFHTKDRTVSRRHVSFQLHSDGARVSFEVFGRNPIWVWSTNRQSLTLFRKFDKGQLEFGDRFSFSGKSPIWFHFNNPTHNDQVAEHHCDTHTDNEASISRPDLDIDQIDLSQFELPKEFGFLVMGHEFDQYPKGMIRNVKDWKWFLEVPRKGSDEEEEDDDDGKEREEMKRKRKKGKDKNEDEEWGGESEEDKDLVAKVRKGKTPRYSTRSKGPNRDTKGSSSTSSKRKKTTDVNETVEEEDDDDEEDETLGGFIVDDEEDDRQQEEENNEEEEEFEDDEEEED